MQYIYALSVITENTTRVLQRIAGILARNCLNIEQLTVFETHKKGTTFFNIVIHSDVERLERVVKQIQRIVELIDIKINSQIPLEEQNYEAA